MPRGGSPGCGGLRRGRDADVAQPLSKRFEHIGQPASTLPAWFSRTLLYGIGLSAAGDYVPFPDAAAEALRAVSGYRLSDAEVEYVLAGFAELPAHPDAEPAMAALSAGGMRMIALTNGTAETTQAFLARTGLDGYIEKVIPTAEVASWKPPARVYHHACDVLGLPGREVALVAVRAWDCHDSAAEFGSCGEGVVEPCQVTRSA